MRVATAGPWSFGWEALVAIGTLVLATATFAVARRTGSLASETKKLATETAAEVRSASRPVLMHKGFASISRSKPGDRDGVLAVQFKNNGAGPAMNAIAAAVTYDGREGTVSELREVGTIAQASIEAATFDVPVVSPLEPDQAVWYWVLIEYGDLAGTIYYSEMRFDSFDPDKALARAESDVYGDTERQFPLAHTRVGTGSHPIVNLHAQWGNASEVPLVAFPELLS